MNGPETSLRGKEKVRLREVLNDFSEKKVHLRGAEAEEMKLRADAATNRR